MKHDPELMLLEVAALERPGLVKVKPSSLWDRCEDHAALLYGLGVDASIETHSKRGCARRASKDDRTLRDYCSGARTVPFAAVLALPREGQLAIAKLLIEHAKGTTYEMEPEPPLKTGTEDR